MRQENTHVEEWDAIIESRSSLLDVNLKELWHYRDLLVLFVRRDFVTVYKQTILGPLWFFIQPIFTTIVFSFVFGKLALFFESIEAIKELMIGIKGNFCLLVDKALSQRNL